ncbi:MAG: CoA pyrophosphatase [Crocinitomicaceae bacterium]|nr:CoA pyrophosphatase [Crocinitomicaceae bacterium]
MQAEEFLNKINDSFQHPLPGIDAHRLLLTGKRALSRDEVNDIDTYKDSAVAVICFPKDKNIHCVLIQRPNYNGSHGGQVSFPGGKKEHTDSSLEYTARRETFEEIGWQLNENHLLGGLTELFIPVSQFTVKPHLYYCEQEQLYIPDKREVDQIFQFPIELLTDDSILKIKNIQTNNGLIIKDVPYFEINQHVVWGATAIILSELRAMIK